MSNPPWISFSTTLLVYFLAVSERGPGQALRNHVVRFRLDHKSLQPEEVVTTRGLLSGFCVSQDHLISYVSTHNEGHFFGQIVPGSTPKFEVFNKLLLSQALPMIKQFTCLVRFGEFFLCVGIQENQAANIISSTIQSHTYNTFEK